jgi:phosphoribosyl-ATP pyrophosphohydrolase/phosphoribosyl-AMP cyclohydrolase
MKLWPAIIQNETSGQILMLGFMNQEALDLTLKSKLITFYSRSRNQLWKKGETSGNFLKLISWSWDCDQDSLLFLVKPEGPTCHLNQPSCFANTAFQERGILESLSRRIDESIRSSKSSLTKEFIKKGKSFWIRKLQEEACEVGLATSFESKDRIVSEAADLLYRLGVLLNGNGIKTDDLRAELEQRNHKAV